MIFLDVRCPSGDWNSSCERIVWCLALPLYAPWRPDAPPPVCINGTTCIVYQRDYDASSNVTVFFKADFV